MADQKPPEDTGRVPASPRDEQAVASGPASAGAGVPEAAADTPARTAPAEPLKGEVSRTDAPGSGVSAAPASAASAATAGKPALGAEAAAPAAARAAAPAAGAAKP